MTDITTVPAATLPAPGPVRGIAEETYSQDADTFASSLRPMTDSYNTSVEAFNVAASEINVVGQEAEASAAAANVSKIDSSGFAGDSATSALTSAGAANLAGAWADQTGAQAPPYSVTHQGRIWVLLVSLADVTASEPGITSDWLAVGSLAIQGRTINEQLVSSDIGANIKFTGGGGFTQTFATVASFSAGWYVYLTNDTTGTITVNADGAETIDELDSYIMYAGEMRFFQKNAAGTGLVSVVMRAFDLIMDSSGSFVKPPGYNYFSGVLLSAAASGQRTGGASDSRGGAGGGSFPFSIPASFFGATETITIGAGGAPVTGVAVGNVGGDSSIGNLLTVNAGSSYTVGGAINNTTDGTTGNIASFAGSAGTIPAFTIYGGAGTSTGSVGGDSVLGGAGAGSIMADGTLRAPGTSLLSGDGGPASATENGGDGQNPAGGGGPTQTGTQSGAGGDGRLEIRGEF